MVTNRHLHLHIAASQGANIYVIGKPAATHSLPQSVHVSNLLLRCKIFAPRKQTGLYLILVCSSGFIQLTYIKSINNSRNHKHDQKIEENIVWLHSWSHFQSPCGSPYYLLDYCSTDYVVPTPRICSQCRGNH